MIYLHFLKSGIDLINKRECALCVGMYVDPICECFVCVCVCVCGCVVCVCVCARVYKHVCVWGGGEGDSSPTFVYNIHRKATLMSTLLTRRAPWRRARRERYRRDRWPLAPPGGRKTHLSLSMRRLQSLCLLR